MLVLEAAGFGSLGTAVKAACQGRPSMRSIALMTGRGLDGAEHGARAGSSTAEPSHWRTQWRRIRLS